MNCKHCNAELEEGMNFCPACGAAQAEPETEAVEVTETVDTVEAPVDTVEAPVEETPAVEEKKAGLGAGKIALLVTLAVAAVAVVIALILGGKGGSNPAETTAPSTPAATNPAVAMTVPADGNPDDVTCKVSYSAEEKELKKQGDKVVATMGDAKLTNSELQVYYWMQVYDFLNQYGSYASMFGLDYTQPMDRQLSIDGKLTWQQYFLDSAVKAWSNYQAMALDAEANGYELEQEYADYLAELPANMADSAAQMGYENAEVMVQRDMGPGATMDGYMKYLSTYYLGYMYYGATMEQVAVTDADIEAYFDAHAAEYQENGLVKGEDRFVDVRHILISPEGGTADESGETVYSEEEWAAAEKKANEVMNEWLTKHPDEDGFGVMAETYTQDPGSATNGGLYEDVQQGDMVPEFDAWCFDENRKPGDVEAVHTNFGCHLIYFVAEEEQTYRNYMVTYDMRAEDSAEWFEALSENYSSTAKILNTKLIHTDLILKN